MQADHLIKRTLAFGAKTIVWKTEISKIRGGWQTPTKLEQNKKQMFCEDTFVCS